ncbi:mechanosensitive ion channel [Nodosilinea sp. LEGE 07088]|uniref:mechanosensitive ion channel family protein n=1 Tax=Nodosilinea sp. LEGE 07088 TaxID=2777968 RepID=UPI001882F00F|nr:mechanosensitive ion channel domain-containing protein [Nodosilinea sp. LEGE 07088]MBE9138497.1 mechanosensitive ion channel [Nodosilinea sp. LEGE 07088]
MDIAALLERFQFDDQARQALIIFAARFGLLIVLVGAAIGVGRLIPWLLRAIITRALPPKQGNIYTAIMGDLGRALATATSLMLISASLNILRSYGGFYRLLAFLVDLAMTLSLAWLLSRISKQVIRLYGINLVKRISDEINDIVLIFETIVDVLIGFFAITIFAQTRNFNFLALLTGLGIVATGVAFAAQEALGQVIGTIVLYLDRPYTPGEYVRINFNIHAEDVYGRIESIGIRSTKIRVAVSNTLLIVPNSIMARKDIENVSRGTKVMVLIYIDFSRLLTDSESALVTQIVEASINNLFGIDPGSTRIHLFQLDEGSGSRARVSFFVMGTSESSLKLRKQLLRLANESISQELKQRNLAFTIQEPTVYVDSPVTL